QIQQLYLQTLTSGGYRELLAQSGQDGLGLAQKKSVQLILLDIMLGGQLNGFDVLEQLKRHPHTTQIPVIMLTNLDSEASVAKEIGAAEYLVKSKVAPPELLEVIKKNIRGDQS